MKLFARIVLATFILVSSSLAFAFAAEPTKIEKTTDEKYEIIFEVNPREHIQGISFLNIYGDVEYMGKDTVTWVKATSTTNILASDTIKTADDGVSGFQLKLNEFAKLNVGNNSEIMIREISDVITRVKLVQGRVLLQAVKEPALEIELPYATISVTGTSFEASSIDDKSTLMAFEGTFDFLPTATGSTIQKIMMGQMVVATSSGLDKIEKIDPGIKIGSWQELLGNFDARKTPNDAELPKVSTLTWVLLILGSAVVLFVIIFLFVKYVYRKPPKLDEIPHEKEKPLDTSEQLVSQTFVDESKD